MAEKEVRKTTTKKTVRKVAPKKATSKTASPKTPVKKTVGRKAPTSVTIQRENNTANNRIVIASVVVFICIVGGSIAFGMTGGGEINIEERIANVKEHATPEERKEIESIPVQKNTLPDGGLVPSGVPETPPPPPPVAKPLATSTDETASSTETVVEESSEEVVAIPETDTDPTDDAPIDPS